MADSVLVARFTAANAKEMAAKSHAARLQRLASGNLAGESLPQTPRVGPDEAAGSYEIKRLARVRKQLDLVDKAFEAEATKATPDGQRLNWLAQAQERLAEQERVLDNRPLPGSRRPRDPASRRASLPSYLDALPWPTLAAPEPTLSKPQQPVLQVLDGLLDGSAGSLPVKLPTPAPTVAPVSIEYALAHGPDRRTTPASQAPPTAPAPRTVITTSTAAKMPTVPDVRPVPIEVALRHRPAPLPTPAAPAPPSQKPG